MNNSNILFNPRDGNTRVYFINPENRLDGFGIRLGIDAYWQHFGPVVMGDINVRSNTSLNYCWYKPDPIEGGFTLGAHLIFIVDSKNNIYVIKN